MDTACDQDIALTVYFDRDCKFCTRVAAWLEGQPKFVPLECVPAQSTGRACPIDPEDLLDDVTVTASDGAVYRGVSAFLICLWALRAYRAWSLRLAQPGMLPWARRLFGLVARFGRVSKQNAAKARKDRQR